MSIVSDEIFKRRFVELLLNRDPEVCRLLEELLTDFLRNPQYNLREVFDSRVMDSSIMCSFKDHLKQKGRY